ncbi:serine/threonine-protein kinase [Peterkaempfera griseoplana]|uniref:serine/threonine-protein kinase n=1 Tax=Peterkaempfera griseoplana TaxID=66896 RepID=UPI0006E41415|nr:serine/threonine-protein kinase [Peterkaempfera griseoplana]
MEPLGPGDPRQVGGYRLLRRLGAGGMGRVYLGRTAGGRTVAVKLVRTDLADDGEFRARFRQEIAAARRVGGAWTAPVLDADTEGEQPWVATGYVAGPALDAAVKEAGPLPERSVRALGSGLAEALTAVHATGLVHRDVKPSNVLLALDGPRLIDFGIARALDATTGLTRSGYVVGSPGYMSPEQAAGGEAGPAGDVFSLGAVLAYAATGNPPFGDGVSAAVLLYRVLHEEPDLAGLPDGPLRDAVQACLAKDASARPTPDGLRAALTAGEGTVRLLSDGWLPAALSASVGRRAAELLDLEDEAAVETAAPWPGQGARSGGTSGVSPVSGSFGPPPEDWAPARPEPEDAPPRAEASGPSDATAGPEPAVPGPLDTTTPPGAGPDPVPAPRSRPGVRAAAAAGVLALAGGGVALALLYGHGTPGSAPTGRPTGTAATAAPQDGAVPAAMVGSWQGDITTKLIPLSSTFQLTVRQGGKGAVVTESRNNSQLTKGAYCLGRGTLVSADARTIVVREEPSGGNTQCLGAPETQTYTLNADGTLHLDVADAAAGDPSGDLAKQG